MMKTVFLPLLLLAGIILQAQQPAQETRIPDAVKDDKSLTVPHLIDFQGRLHDNDGNPVQGSRSVIFSFYAAPSGGTALWTETRTVQFVDGLFGVSLGEVTPLDPSVFSSADRWLGIRVGTDAEMTPRTRIASVGYALQTHESDPTWTGAADATGSISRMGLVGIGTETPAAPLHVVGMETGEGNVLFEGVYQNVDPGDPPTTGAGTRMMWYPDKAAFRAGRVSDSGAAKWDKDSVGFYSFATGWNTRASGFASTAMGNGTTASGISSTAMGNGTTASGGFSTAMGLNTRASNFQSTAMGVNTTASGDYSTAIGRNTTAAGRNSIAMGYFTNAPSVYETALGSFNALYTPTSPFEWNSSDRLFVIGNGTSEGNRRDALVMLKNGNMGLGVSNPQQRLHVNGRMILDNGVIQRGGDPITTTSDLGLYSRTAGSFMRFVTNNAPFVFMTGDGTNGTGINERMRITNTGIVGIGTSSPNTNSRLHVQGNILTSGQVIITTNGTVWMQTASQNVLDIDGTLRPMNNNAFSIGNSIKRWNTIFATNGSINTSDQRLKNNIEDMPYGLQEILKMRPVTFNWIDRQEDGNKLGFLAQDLMEIVPEVVLTREAIFNSETNALEYKEVESLGVFYSDIIPVVVKGMQEQQAMINQQEHTIQEHQQTILEQQQVIVQHQQSLEAQQQIIDTLVRRIEALEAR